MLQDTSCCSSSSSSSGASRSNQANRTTDGVHASIAPNQTACKVVIAALPESLRTSECTTSKWNFCSKRAFVGAIHWRWKATESAWPRKAKFDISPGFVLASAGRLIRSPNEMFHSLLPFQMFAGRLSGIRGLSSLVLTMAVTASTQARIRADLSGPVRCQLSPMAASLVRFFETDRLPMPPKRLMNTARRHRVSTAPHAIP